MSEIGGLYRSPDEYWSVLDTVAEAEVDIYRSLFVGVASRRRARGRFMRGERLQSYYRTYAPVQVPSQLIGEERPWQARLAQKEITKAKSGEAVIKIVTPMLHVNSQPDDNVIFVENIVRPSLLVTEVDGRVEAAELADITDLICTPPEEYMAAQKAWMERLGAIDIVLNSGAFIEQRGAA